MENMIKLEDYFSPRVVDILDGAGLCKDVEAGSMAVSVDLKDVLMSHMDTYGLMATLVASAAATAALIDIHGEFGGGNRPIAGTMPGDYNA